MVSFTVYNATTAARYQRDKAALREELAQAQAEKDAKYTAGWHLALAQERDERKNARARHGQRLEEARRLSEERLQRDYAEARTARDLARRRVVDGVRYARRETKQAYQRKMADLQVECLVGSDEEDDGFVQEVFKLANRPKFDAPLAVDDGLDDGETGDELMEDPKEPAAKSKKAAAIAREAAPTSKPTDPTLQSETPASPQHPSSLDDHSHPDAPEMMPPMTGARDISPQPWPTRTIPYDEVFQNGNAPYKHVIVQFAPGSAAARYFILRCDKHHVHFGRNPIAGAAKHLWSAAHSAKDKSYSRAISMVGIEVIGCDEQRLEENNAVALAAMSVPGWKPFNANHLPKASKARFSVVKRESVEPEMPLTRPPPPRAALAAPAAPRFPGITRPEPLHLYLGTCRDATNPVLVLGWANEMSSVGQPDNFRSTHLPQQPECYRFDPATGDITGWAPGFEDGGPQEPLREFPVLWACDVDADGDPCWGMMWCPAALLSEFNTWTVAADADHDDDPLGTSARRYFARDLHGFDSLEAMALAQGRKLKQYIVLSESDDNLTVFSRTPSVEASRPASAHGRKGRAGPKEARPRPEGPVLDVLRKKKKTATKDQTAKRTRDDDVQALVGDVPVGKKRRRPDTDASAQASSEVPRPPEDNNSPPPTPANNALPRLATAGFTPINVVPSPLTPATARPATIKPEHIDSPARDRLQSLAHGLPPLAQSIAVHPPTHPNRPHGLLMATPVSVSPTSPSAPIADDTFNLVGVIRLSDSWTRADSTDPALVQLQTLHSSSDSHWAATTPSSPVTLTIDPLLVIQALRVSVGAGAGAGAEQANLTLIMQDESEVTLMFARDARRAAMLAARQFQRWLMGRNERVELLREPESHRYGL